MNNVISAIYISTSLLLFFIVRVIIMYAEQTHPEKPLAFMKMSVYYFPYIPLVIGLIYLVVHIVSVRDKRRQKGD
ncbi:hypothetical protein [Ornithinibacillus halophilus]|uniref:Uncharacterized protein n=1 Tax=Ornithinibacillus halophilus TaxID=930117 RepID=A0A1M5KT33_9BACI|nr:hypothetical protein [Ornithinibacillus halophilus]SHG55905.1 hypothetical protein SAMN05216225_10418 [Ornithinibacillus halophilus]